MSWLTGSATDGEYSIIVTSAVCQYPSHAGTQCSQCPAHSVVPLLLQHSYIVLTVQQFTHKQVIIIFITL